ncbi:MAG: Rne/Rng family ribonuclease [Phycisphaerales bacterium]|nr:Rne/Rng family ribonuclease [Phycisphaerales bacterium]
MTTSQMLINYVPGEECRVAIVEDGLLQEYHAERTSAVSRVGNVYLGKVMNVEPGIQAAFVDFGVGVNGFLHVSDVHPSHFPGSDDDDVEKIGKKTPRRERPPIQACFRRGQEVIVQVLKEGVGTKGPSLTTYLSIPGRYLVMMPQMDKVGVSRKVEDEDARKQMREILDQLDLPENFGFILRTAGMDKTKAELKRDLAYLQRLWKDIERRRTSRSLGPAPRLLYAESDLLVRALRDLVTSDTSEIVIDNEKAVERAGRFLKIFTPRSGATLKRYTASMPLFHATGIEPQIAQMHAREVPLPSGGRLVIDETEALVAIDVNSGKMRGVSDSETNAFKTNMEAVDEICRQLRLRDMGGLVINDMIDMSAQKNRRAVEQRFRDRLKRDRAKTTTLPISSFGILEMTRQRMRGSHETQHFSECPTCHGRGLVQRSTSVASDALRELSSVLAHEKVGRVELVVSARVAGELLSTRRRTLSRIEKLSGKHVDVRVSETLALDRFTIYAYDGQGADLELERLPQPKLRAADVVVFEIGASADEDWAVEPREEPRVVEEAHDEEPEPELPDIPGEHDVPDEPASEGGKKKRRRRRRGRGRGEGAARGEGEARPARGESDDGGDADGAPASSDDDGEHDGDAAPSGDGASSGEGGKKKRRRRRRGRGRREGDASQDGAAHAAEGEDAREASEHRESDAEPAGEADDDAPDSHSDSGGEGGKKKRRRRRRGRGRGEGTSTDAPASGQREPASDARPARTGSGGSRAASSPAPAPAAAAPTGEEAKPKRRSLYGSARRKLSAKEKSNIKRDE